MLFLARYSEVSEPIIFQYIFLRQKSRQKMGSKVERVYGSGVTMGGLGGCLPRALDVGAPKER